MTSHDSNDPVAWRVDLVDSMYYVEDIDDPQAVDDLTNSGATITPLYVAPPADGMVMARRFHETYERLAPQFGYETRADTKQFDPESPNGRLMIAVCAALSAAPDAKAGGKGEGS